MIVRAPGKLVLSGAYAVLEGAPALVAAVDRYVLADPARPAERITEEVQAAIDAGALDRAVWFDASALRSTEPAAAAGAPAGASRKLGLGSSAAILVATLAARAAATAADASATATDASATAADAAAGAAPRRAAPPWDTRAIFLQALAAHRRAQGGGSGVDVAASVHGGVICCRLGPGGELAVAPHVLPSGLVIEVLASAQAARTSVMLERVRALAARDPEAHRALLGAAGAGARAAALAADVRAFVAALDAQVDALTELGDRAGAPIVTPELRRLRRAAAAEGAALAPSGAGGGDVTLFVGGAPPSAAFLAAARASGLEREPMSLGAPGVHVLDASRPPRT